MATTFAPRQKIKSAEINANFLEKTDKATLTTKGDVYVATGAGLVVRQAVGSDDQSLVADSSQTNGISYHTEIDGNYIKNLSLAASVGSNALTISLKTAAGNNASATDPVKFAFRSSTLATGTLTIVKVTAALSTVISSGSTAGHSSAVESPIYVGVLNNAGAVELCWSTTPWNENELISTTAEGGAGAADSATTIYSTSARSSVGSRIVGKLLSTQTTAGTWTVIPTNISSGPASKLNAWIPPTVQKFTSGSGTYTLPVSPRKPLYIVVEMVGGGGGGGGSGTTSGTAATNGADTTFGTALLSAGGGGLGVRGGAGGTAGTASLGTGPVGLALSGAIGQASNSTTAAAQTMGVFGPQGAGSALGGGGGGGLSNSGSTASSGTVNTGGGGGAGGIGTTSSAQTGSGGGSGGYVKALLTSPLATYSYAVGAGGSGQAAGTSGSAGGAGGSGVIVVTEFYQ